MRKLIEDLCNDNCAGRATGTRGGRAARALVIDALREAGLDPYTQAIPACNGSNIIATLEGDTDRWVVVSAHYDHLGRQGKDVFRGADDIAAAIGILVETARTLAAQRAQGRGVMFVAFDSEEPPYFLTEAMGAMHFTSHPPVPLDRIDMMIGMDLVGHNLGESASLPTEVRQSVFALGAERSVGSSARLDALARVEPGIIVRPMDAEVVPTMSDYAAFWRRGRPFLFLTNGRSRRYHTVDDTPEHLAWDKMAATASWLDRYVRDTCARDDGFDFVDRRCDRITLDSLIEVLSTMTELSASAEHALTTAQALRNACDKDGVLPGRLRSGVESLVVAIEAALS